LAVALKALIPTKQPVYLWGPPGVGKSSIVKQATDGLELEMLDIRAVLLDPVDLRGLPRIHGENGDGTAEWCPPKFLPRQGKGVVFLDELAQAPPLVQAACLQLTLDRRVGEYELPPDWTIVAASNRAEDRAGAHRLISPLLNRFIHLDLEVSHDDWHAWAITAGIAPEVRAFLRFKPALLHAFDPSAGARAFPTPRSWEFVARTLPAVPDILRHPVFAGTVGDGPAAEFVAFLQIYQQLPDPDQVLANPTGSTVPREPSVLYALCGALTEKVRRGEAKHWLAFTKYVSRMPDEFGVLAMRDGCACQPRLLQLPEAASWVKSHRDILLAR
jgi:hypothetical protein